MDELSSITQASQKGATLTLLRSFSMKNGQMWYSETSLGAFLIICF